VHPVLKDLKPSVTVVTHVRDIVIFLPLAAVFLSECGSPPERCNFCSGCGTQTCNDNGCQNGRCPCFTCRATGICECEECKGNRKLLTRSTLVVRFTTLRNVHEMHEIPEEQHQAPEAAPLSQAAPGNAQSAAVAPPSQETLRQITQECKRIQLFQHQSSALTPQHVPASLFPSVLSMSLAVLAEAQQSLYQRGDSATALLCQQTLTVEQVPIHRVVYATGSKQNLTLWILGRDMLVHDEQYPATCCCCRCTIM
jgi:hypothetical protein